MGMKEVAQSLGISKSTVSLAINNKPGVSEDTRKKVMAAMIDLGYKPRRMIRTLAETEKSVKFFACVGTGNGIPSHYNLASSFFSELIYGIEQECKKNKFSLSFATIPLDSFASHLEQERETCVFDAAILLGTGLSAKQIEFAIGLFPKTVVLDTFYEHLDVDFVMMNNSMGGYKAASYLYSLGHRSIGYVQCVDRFINVDLRKRGFSEALMQNQLTVAQKNYFTVENRIDAAKDTLYAVFSARGKSLPTAVFCETDYIAIGTVKALQDCGLNVPEDISVIGFDDVPEAMVLSPELSTIRVDKATIGKLAVNRLVEVLKSENPGPTVKQIVDTYFVLRGSCAECNTNDEADLLA